MKLNEFIESKKEELLNDGFKSAKFVHAHNEKLERRHYGFGHTFIIDSNYFKGVSMDAEVDLFDEESARDSMIVGDDLPLIAVSFDVVKPKCRKAVSHTVYAKQL